MNAKTAALGIALAFVLTPGAANAKKPHPLSSYDVTVDACECTDTGVRVDVSDVIEGDDATVFNCTVSWSSTPAAPAYGASLEFAAEWDTEEGTLVANSEDELDAYECSDADPAICEADGDITIPDTPAEVEASFVAKVKGFDNGAEGAVSRDFVKSQGDCSIVEPEPEPEPEV